MASAYRKYGDKISWIYEGDPNSPTNMTKGEKNPGITYRENGKVIVRINSFAFTDPGWTYLVIGHEFIHADHLMNNQYDKWAAKYDDAVAAALTEFHAYAWQTKVSSWLGYDSHGSIEMLFKYIPFVPMQEIANYAKK